MIDDVLVHGIGARRLDDLHREEGLPRTAVALKTLDQRDPVCTEAERSQQPSGGSFCGRLCARSVLDADFLLRLEHAVELWCRTSQVADFEPAIQVSGRS